MQSIKRERRGFTLLEILLVIALIGILASIVLVAINPNRQLGQARNSVRLSDQNNIAKAIEQYTVNNRGAYPSGITGSYQDICPVGVSTNCIDLSVLVPSYITAIPIDPSGGNYQIAINPSNEQISLKAPTTEIGTSIAINPFTSIMTFAKSIGGAADDFGGQVSTLSDGGSIVVGAIDSNAFFGSFNMFISRYSSSGDLIWTKRSVNGPGGAQVGAQAVDTLADGSSIVMGAFKLTATFGQGEPNQTSLTSIPTPGSLGDYNLFIAKYNPDGTLVWVKRAGGINSDAVLDINTLSDGSSIITGYLNNPATFGVAGSNQVTVTSAGSNDGYIAKYNPDGILVWAKGVGGTSVDVGQGVSVFSDGSSILTGYFQGTATFGAGELNQTNLVAVGSSDIFIAKYNVDGTLAWTKRAGGTGSDNGNDTISLSDGSSLVTGSFSGTATFGAGELNQTNLVAVGSSDIFIAKYNADGTLAWTKRAGGTGDDRGNDTTSLSDGSSLVTGSFSGTATFGAGELNQTNLVAVGSNDIFIAKYNADGTLAWAKGAGGIDSDGGSGIEVFSDGRFSISGTFGGFSGSTVTFGLGELNPITLTNAGRFDAFIAKYNADGTL